MKKDKAKKPTTLKKNDAVSKKKVKKSIDAALEMNKAGVECMKQLGDKYKDTFTAEEKEDIKRLENYLDETLTVFFKNLLPKK